MSISPPKSPFWQPEDSHRRQDSTLLNKVSHGSRQDWEHWASLDRSYHAHTNPTSSPHPYLPDTTTDEPAPENERPDNPNHQTHQKCTLKTILLNWWSEILWLSFATTNLTLIAILLSLLSNNPLTTWRFPISINAVVSAMMIATKAALIYTSATCIGQLKWHHFQHSVHGHCIHDLKLFDEANLDLGTPRQFPLQFAETWDKTNDTSNLVDTQSVCTATGDYPAELNNTFTISQGKEYFLKYAVRLILKAGYQGADFYTQLTLATSSLDYTDTTAMSSNLAAFMTNALRTQDGTQSIGTAWESVTFIEVRW
ncbi:hypothetical protein D6C80_05303 [Aureobasidium pullulans]|nr:hypothetical protein D6C80_05303 [Aureobasidium pullulans]